jgi:hypothetical protein
MPTKKQRWPEEYLGEKERLLRLADELNGMLLVSWEYGIQAPGRHIPFLRGTLPQIRAKLEKIYVTTNVMRKESTRTWPLWVKFALDEISTASYNAAVDIGRADLDMRRNNFIPAERALSAHKDVGAFIYNLIVTQGDSPNGLYND